MQFLKLIIRAAMAGAAMLAAITTPSLAEERKAGSFEFFAALSGGLKYADSGNSNGGKTGFVGGTQLGFDIAVNDDGVALGLEGGYEYFGELPAKYYWATFDAETDGFTAGLYTVIPVSTGSKTRLRFGAGAVFWNATISQTYGYYYYSGEGSGTGYYASGGVDFEVAGPFHAGLNLRFSQLASDMYIISPQFRLGLHF